MPVSDALVSVIDGINRDANWSDKWWYDVCQEAIQDLEAGKYILPYHLLKKIAERGIREKQEDLERWLETLRELIVDEAKVWLASQIDRLPNLTPEEEKKERLYKSEVLKLQDLLLRVQEREGRWRLDLYDLFSSRCHTFARQLRNMGYGHGNRGLSPEEAEQGYRLALEFEKFETWMEAVGFGSNVRHLVDWPRSTMWLKLAGPMAYGWW